MGEEVKQEWSHTRDEVVFGACDVRVQHRLYGPSGELLASSTFTPGAIEARTNEKFEQIVAAINSHADLVELAHRVLILKSACECDPDADYGCIRCLAKDALAKAGEA